VHRSPRGGPGEPAPSTASNAARKHFVFYIVLPLLAVALAAGWGYASYHHGMERHGRGWDNLSWWEIPEGLCAVSLYVLAVVWWGIATAHRPWWRRPVGAAIVVALAALAVYCNYRLFSEPPRQGRFSTWLLPFAAATFAIAMIVRSWWRARRGANGRSDDDDVPFFIHTVTDARPCPTCGYDLRASPDRCPECGMPAK
jgi:hypothetical protein